MTLSCFCDDYDAEWYWECACEDFMMLDTKRGRHCASCKTWIKPGEDVVKFWRYRPAHEGVEQRIYGEDHDAVGMAPWYLCETCGGLCLSFYELGFTCVAPYENMRKLAAEYAEVYGRKSS